MCRCSDACCRTGRGWSVSGARPHSVKEEVDDESWCGLSADRTWRRYGAVKAFAQAAEELGYDHIVIDDHVLGAVHAGREPKLTGPYKETDPFHEPLITYAYLAGVTKKLELVTGVIILPQRQTALSQNRRRMSTCSQRAGFAWASGSAGTGWNSTVSKCPTFSPPRPAAGASDRVAPQAVGAARGRHYNIIRNLLARRATGSVAACSTGVNRLSMSTGWNELQPEREFAADLR